MTPFFLLVSIVTAPLTFHRNTITSSIISLIQSPIATIILSYMPIICSSGHPNNFSEFRFFSASTMTLISHCARYSRIVLMASFLSLKLFLTSFPLPRHRVAHSLENLFKNFVVTWHFLGNFDYCESERLFSVTTSR